jgi:hypothetical protein
MLRNTGLWATVAVLIGVLQAWDSGLFAVPFNLSALALCAIAASAAVIGLPVAQGVRLVTLIAAAIGLTVVRLAAPVPLNTLHLALFVPAIYILFVNRWAQPAR